MLYMTRQERAVIVFLVGMALSGLCINFMFKRYPATEKLLAPEEAQGKLDINRASAGDLEQLKGIGPALAANIIAYRDKYGQFKSIDGLRQVRGIGKSKYDQIKDLCITEAGSGS